MFVALIVTVVSIVFSVKGNHKLYWIASLSAYIFSFIAAFSIGQITVGLVFIPLTLAIGYSLHLIRNKMQAAVFMILGIFIGAIMVLYVDDAWLFFPFRFLS
ncbi:hypothetical protein [Bacillus sp. FJAT-29814]|uniref:hypothetical protein n=1 Tax=Bacillus sp. FJAT-29814 TaxID=1729688 RepID=UPI0008360767|nr:hypothetical protein [Bacillus sp. FJAT-29814]